MQLQLDASESVLRCSHRSLLAQRSVGCWRSRGGCSCACLLVARAYHSAVSIRVRGERGLPLTLCWNADALQDNKADVIDKYLPDEVRALKTAGELPDSVKLNETEEGGEDNFEFGSGGEEEESGDESDKSDKDEDIDVI